MLNIFYIFIDLIRTILTGIQRSPVT